MLRRLKRIVPHALWVGGRKTANYLRRLRNWRAVVREVRGVTLADAAVIQRSVRAGVRSAGADLDRWRDPVLIADATVRLAGIGDFAIRGQTDDLFAILPSRERAVVAAFRTHLKTGSTFIDAGANIGFFTILAARLVGAGGRVIAIEMMPDTAALLRANVERNGLGNVTIVEGALSNRSGEEVVASMPEDQFARASIAQGLTVDRRQIRVRTKTLDDLLVGIAGNIDLIKMDLEGAEPMAIEGAGDVLARTRAVIFEQLEGGAARRLLEHRGFALRMLDATNVLAERILP